MLLFLLEFLNCDARNVEIDFCFLLQGHGVEAEPLEGLNLPLVLINVVQVNVLGSKDAVCKKTRNMNGKLKIQWVFENRNRPKSGQKQVWISDTNFSLKTELAKLSKNWTLV